MENKKGKSGLPHAFTSGLEITPLWRENIPQTNHACAIDNETIAQGHVTLYSSTDHVCGLKVSTSDEYNIILETSDGLDADDKFYVERLNSSEQCPARFVNIQDKQTCNTSILSTIFVHKELQVNLQSNSEVTIREEKLPCDAVPTCPENNQSQAVNLEIPSSECFSIKGHDNITECDLKFSKWSNSLGICNFTFYSDCNLTIYQKEVSLECPESDEPQNQIFLLSPPQPSILEIGYYAQNAFMNKQTIAFDIQAFANYHHVQALYLEGCYMLDLDPELLKPLEKLKYLNLKFNRFGLSDFPEDVFMYVRNLTHLYLSMNQFQTLPTKLLHGMFYLEELRLDRNNLTSLDITFFKDTVQLVNLNLNDNEFRTLAPGMFANLENLELLQLKRNKINGLENGAFQGLVNLKTLNLMDNSLTTLPANIFQSLVNLSKIILRKNQLNSLPKTIFQGLAKLSEIQLGFNNFSEITNGLFHNIATLRQLSLQYNGLTTVEGLFEPNVTLTKFENLNLGFNELETLPEMFLDILPNLEQLRINHNVFMELDINLFKRHFKELIFVDVSGNKLNEIPKIGNSKNLKLLAASQNPLSDISRDSFSDFSKDTKFLVSQHEICECFAPSDIPCIADEMATPYLTCDRKDRLIDDSILRLAVWTVGLTIIGGNLFLLVWRQGQKHAVSTGMQSMLVINLSLSNLIMGFYLLLLAFADVYFGREFYKESTFWRSGWGCKIGGFLNLLSAESSILFITLISIERIINTRCLKLQKKYRKRFAIVSIVITWILSVAIGIVPCILADMINFYNFKDECVTLPLVHGLDYTKHAMADPDITKFVKSWELNPFYYAPNWFAFGPIYSIAIFFGLNGFCVLLTLCCFIVIVCCTRSNSTDDRKSQVTLTKRIIAIVVMSCFCWFLLIFLGVLVQTRALTIPGFIYPWLVVFVFCITAALNPFLYLAAVLITKCSSCCRKDEAEEADVKSGEDVYLIDCDNNEKQEGNDDAKDKDEEEKKNDDGKGNKKKENKTEDAEYKNDKQNKDGGADDDKQTEKGADWNKNNDASLKADEETKQEESDIEKQALNPDNEGGKAEPDDKGGKANPDDDGSKAKPDDEGGKAKPDDEGGKAKPDDEGGKVNPDDEGGKANPDDGGGKANPDGEGGKATDQNEEADKDRSKDDEKQGNENTTQNGDPDLRQDGKDDDTSQNKGDEKQNDEQNEIENDKDGKGDQEITEDGNAVKDEENKLNREENGGSGET